MYKAKEDNVHAGYHVAVASEIRELERQVAEYIALGWTPVGGVMVVRHTEAFTMTTYHQSLWYRNGS